MEDFPPLGRRVTRRSAPENHIALPLNEQRRRASSGNRRRGDNRPMAPPRGDGNLAPRDRHDGGEREVAPVVQANQQPAPGQQVQGPEPRIAPGQHQNPAAVLNQPQNPPAEPPQQRNQAPIVNQRHNPEAGQGQQRQQRNPAAEPGHPVDDAPAPPNAVNIDGENEGVSNVVFSITSVVHITDTFL